MTYLDIVERRRELKIDGYKTLADAGFHGQYVSPYQISSNSPDGPVLVAYNWFDFPSATENREVLKRLGYMPGIRFNKVMDLALGIAKMVRSDLYVTQAFHLLPAERSEKINARDVDTSFDAVTRYELIDRRVIAIGNDSADACRRHGVKCVATMHLSARGPGLTHDFKAGELARALIDLRH
jgi:hypothetical protein